MASVHVVRDLTFEVGFSSEEEAFAQHERLGSFVAERLLTVADEVFSRVAPADAVVRLDLLDVDLGSIPAAAFYEEAELRFRDRLEEVLRQKLLELDRSAMDRAAIDGAAMAWGARAVGADGGADGADGADGGSVASVQGAGGFARAASPAVISESRREFDIVLHYLERGFLPWNAQPSTGQVLDEILRRLAETAGPELAARLRSADDKALLARRLAWQFSDDALRAVSTLLATGGASGDVARAVSTLLATGGASGDVSRAVTALDWEATLLELLQGPRGDGWYRWERLRALIELGAMSGGADLLPRLAALGKSSAADLLAPLIRTLEMSASRTEAEQALLDLVQAGLPHTDGRPPTARTARTAPTAPTAPTELADGAVHAIQPIQPIQPKPLLPLASPPPAERLSEVERVLMRADRLDAAGTAELVRTLERLLLRPPAGFHGVMRRLAGDAARIDKLSGALPERQLARLLQLGAGGGGWRRLLTLTRVVFDAGEQAGLVTMAGGARDAGHDAGVPMMASAVVDAGEQAATRPGLKARRRLKWPFLFDYLVGRGRAASESAYLPAYVAWLAVRSGRSDPDDFKGELVRRLRLDARPTLAAMRRLAAAILDRNEASPIEAPAGGLADAEDRTVARSGEIEGSNQDTRSGARAAGEEGIHHVERRGARSGREEGREQNARSRARADRDERTDDGQGGRARADWDEGTDGAADRSGAADAGSDADAKTRPDTGAAKTSNAETSGTETSVASDTGWDANTKRDVDSGLYADTRTRMRVRAGGAETSGAEPSDAKTNVAETPRGAEADWGAERRADVETDVAARSASDPRMGAADAGGRADFANHSDIFILNAGQVLAAPFLPRLFTLTGLLENNRFRDAGAGQRAIHLLQYLVDQSIRPQEHFLSLNKILCGFEPGTPVRRDIDLLPAEKDAVDGLLAAMVAHWSAIGKTSVRGLRESFLQREGRLRTTAGGWQLLVQPRAFDLLLDRLPWGFKLIRHPWMDAPVYVEWR